MTAKHPDLPGEKLTFDAFKARFVADLVEAWGEGARQAAEGDAPLWYEDYRSGRMTFADCVAGEPDYWEF